MNLKKTIVALAVLISPGGILAYSAYKLFKLVKNRIDQRDK